MKPKAVTVAWVDAAAGNEWEDIDSINTDETPCFSIGYLVKETRLSIVLAATVARDEDGEITAVNATQLIPKAVILRRSDRPSLMEDEDTLPIAPTTNAELMG